MKFIDFGGQKALVIALDTLIIGSGCAGFNAADTLYDMGRTDIAILTEGVNMGTSRNTGSDKQTYYKLSLCSDGADSIYELAENLFQGGSVNGDTALAEAAGSVRSFSQARQSGSVQKNGENNARRRGTRLLKKPGKTFFNRMKKGLCKNACEHIVSAGA